MTTVKKAIILMILLAIIIPIAYSSKLISWLSPRDLNSANVFQSLGVNVASFINSFKGSEDTTVYDSSSPQKQPDKQESFKVPQKPYRVLIVGDSLVAVSGGFGDIMEQKLIAMDSVEVLRKGKVSSGLSRPDYFNWNKESLSLIDSFSPNVAIVMMGTNDAQSFEIVKDGAKKVLSYGSLEWDNEYANRFRAFNQQFTSRGVAVYWIGLPAMRDSGYAQKISHLNEIIEKTAKENVQVRYVSGEKLMAGDKGAYQAFLPDDKGVMHATRLADGIHLTYFGGNYLVQKVIDVLKKDIDLKESASN